MGRLLKVITTGPSLPANAGTEMAMSSEPQVLHLLAIDHTSCREIELPLFCCEFLQPLFEDRSCREAHGTGVGVEVEEVLSVPFRPVLDLPYTLPNNRVGGRVSWSVALVGRKQLMIHRALRQAGLLVCPFDEISEGLFSRVDSRVADDP